MKRKNGAASAASEAPSPLGHYSHYTSYGWAELLLKERRERCRLRLFHCPGPLHLMGTLALQEFCLREYRKHYYSILIPLIYFRTAHTQELMVQHLVPPKKGFSHTDVMDP